MERARLEELWSRFLAGGALAPAEEEELADAVDADPRLLAELSKDLQIDGTLRGLGLSETAFVDSFAYRLRAEQDGTRFISTMKAKMKRSRRPPTRRWTQPEWTGTRIGIAAALLLGFAGLLILATPSRDPVRKTESVRRSTEPREVPEPVRETPEVPKSKPSPVALPSPAPEPSPLLPTAKKEETPTAPAPAPDPRVPIPPETPRVTVGTPAAPAPAVATVTRVNGDVTAAAAPVKAGQKLLAGQALESAGAKSGAQLQFADGTRVDLGPDTLVSEVTETRGKRIVLTRGVLNADVAKQPAELPLLIATPHGEAKVLGTVFRIAVEAGGTRLDVKEGKVRLTRGADQKAVDVPAGCYVSTGTGGDYDLNSEHKVTVSFQDGVSPTPKYSGTSDAILSEAAKLVDKNLGAVNALWVDGDTTVGDDRYIVLRWDVSALPARCQVLSATIDVQVTNDNRGSRYEIYELKRDWVEKDVTWKSFASKMPWQTPGAQGAQDRGTAVLGVLAPPKAGAYTLRLSADGVAALQSWIDQPAANHGIIIANPDNADAVGLHSREASVPANRPRLNVTFVPRAK